MKINLRIIVLPILIGLYIISCKKDDSGPSDFRDKYIGKYQVHKKIRSYGLDECGASYIIETDTIISVVYGITDTTLDILGRDVYLDSTGSFYDVNYGLLLRDNSISSTFMNGGINCGHYEIYKGIRVSSRP